MSFSLEHKTLIIGKTYGLKSRLEMSAPETQPTVASEPIEAEQIIKAGMEFFPELIEERIKATL